MRESSKVHYTAAEKTKLLQDEGFNWGLAHAIANVTDDMTFRDLAKLSKMLQVFRKGVPR